MESEYIPRNLLLTGGAGFIGSNMVNYLVFNYPDVNVFVIDKLDYCASMKNLEDCTGKPNFKFIKGSTVDHNTVEKIFKENNIDTIINYAAQSYVDNSFGRSYQFTIDNILGTHVLLEVSKKYPVKRFIHVSTDEVYGEALENQEGMDENSILAPTNPYAATKAGAEQLCHAYIKSYNIPIIITRGNNVYGPRQYPEKLIPKFINLILNGKKCPIHGKGNNTRNFMHVSDVCYAFDIVMKRGKIGEIYNIGGQYEIPVLTVAKQILALMNMTDCDSHLEYVEDRCFNDLRYPVRNEKLVALGWEERISWDEGLKQTIEWYLSHQNHWSDIEMSLVAHPRRLDPTKLDAAKMILAQINSLSFGKFIDDTESLEKQADALSMNESETVSNISNSPISAMDMKSNISDSSSFK